jgi:hypothetical protein
MSAEALNKARDRWLNSFKKDARGLIAIHIINKN